MMSETRLQHFSEGHYAIRPAKSNEQSRQIWWPFMQKLGWNRGWYDLPTYMDHSRASGMHLIFPPNDTRPVGHVAAIVNSNSTGWISMFIVDPVYQGLGLGAGLFEAAMRDFGKSGTEIIGLDGVAEQKGTYERRGFVESKLGVVRLMSRPLVAKEMSEPVAAEMANTIWLVDLRDIKRELLVEHERLYTGFQRRDLWTDRNMFARPDVRGFALVDKSDPDSVENLFAWTMVRRCSDGARLGPLYARDEAVAKLVLAAITQEVTTDYIKSIPMEGEAMNSWSDEQITDQASLVAEVWTGNPSSIPIFESLGWRASGHEYHRMWLGGKATEAQSEGGSAQTGLFAVFDAAIG